MEAGGIDAEIKIEPLGPSHDRAAFSCGNALIDEFCTKKAQKDHDRYKVRVFVASEVGAVSVIGFYSLTIRSIEPGLIPGIGFGGRDIPAIYLSMIGVCSDRQGCGIGTDLIYDAFGRCVRVSEDVGAYCIWLTAVDEPTLEYYESLGFLRTTPGKLNMYLPLQTLRTAAQAAIQA
jgi:GNAT superfamily N-acetyltransferase